MKRTFSQNRVEEIARGWAKDNTVTRLRAAQKAQLTDEKCARFGLTIGEAWAARNRAIAIKTTLRNVFGRRAK